MAVYYFVSYSGAIKITIHIGQNIGPKEYREDNLSLWTTNKK